MRMPEEINRIATDRISDLLFAPTHNALEILTKTGLENNSFYSGDIMLDSVLYFDKKTEKKDFSYLNLPKKFYLSTIHRPANTDNIDNLKSIFRAFEEFEHKVVLPLHPRTRSKIQKMKLKNIIVLPPVSYLEMIHMIKKSVAVLTDSGGLQKEAFFLKKKCVTLREETEWLETINGGWNILTGANYQKIKDAIGIVPIKSEYKNYFGDGSAAKKIVDILEAK